MSAAAQPVSRGPFDGVLQIVRYNWSLYALAIAGSALVVAVVLLFHLPAVLSWVLVIGAGAGAFWLLVSLAVSHYIYDRSGLYHWSWILDELGLRPRRLVNITAGLDETSGALRQLYPDCELTVLDIYNPEAMPEPSIARARLEGHAQAGTVPADFRALPLEAGSVDTALVIFTAHELREPASRDVFFKEARRVLVPGGRLLLVEHLRDGWNLAAFGPGAFHFFPRSEWRRVARSAGFDVDLELSRTPFVHALTWKSRT